MAGGRLRNSQNTSRTKKAQASKAGGTCTNVSVFLHPPPAAPRRIQKVQAVNTQHVATVASSTQGSVEHLKTNCS
jgi:hypothetical protein